jgi:L-fuconolactonase
VTIDSHQHFWSVSSGRYDYPRPSDGVIYRDFAASNLAPMLAAAGVDQTIVVQAVDAEWETGELLTVATVHRWIAGVVGWCDLGRKDASTTLAGYMENGRLVGVRPMLQKQDDASWLLAPDASANLDWMAGRGLVFDALVDVRHLPVIEDLVVRHPMLPVVIDHMAKPWRQPDRVEEWSAGIQSLGRYQNCHVKVSGYPFADSHAHDGYADLVASLLDWFGSDRLIWGSDWPVSTRHLPYEQGVARARQAFGEADWDKAGHANAARVYGLKPTGASETQKENTP